MMHLGDTQTDEPNGLEVRVDVKPEDTRTFIERAADVYQWFDVKPTTNVELNYRKYKKLTETPKWFIYGDDKAAGYYYARHYKTLLVMGGVAYTIDHDELDRNMLNLPLVVTAPLGVVSITPGRESLSYDNHTVKWLKETFDAVKQELSTQLLDGVTGTDYERAVTLVDKYRKLTYELQACATLPKSFKASAIETVGQMYYVKTKGLCEFSVFNQRKKTSDSCSSVNITKNLHIMLCDTKTGLNLAAHEYLDTFDEYTARVLLVKGTPDALKQWVLAAGNPPVVNASDYLVKRTTTKGVKVPSTFSMKKSSGYSFYGDTNKIEEGYTYYYVELHNGNYTNITSKELKAVNILAYLVSTYESKKVKLVGVNKKYLKTAKNHPQFKPWAELTKDFSSVTTTNDEVYDKYNKYNFLNIRDALPKSIEKRLLLVRESKGTQQRGVTASNLHDLEVLIESKKIIVTYSNNEAYRAIKWIEERYPLLTYITDRYTKRSKMQAEVKRYIELEDFKRKHSKGE